MGVNFINIYQNLVISKSGEKVLKMVKFEVENFEHLRCKFKVETFKHLCSNTRVNLKQKIMALD